MEGQKRGIGFPSLGYPMVCNIRDVSNRYLDQDEGMWTIGLKRIDFWTFSDYLDCLEMVGHLRGK